DVVAFENDLLELLDLARVEPQHRLALELVDQAVRDRVDRDHFLLGDAHDVVVERGAAHDRVRRLPQLPRPLPHPPPIPPPRPPPAGASPGPAVTPFFPESTAAFTPIGPPAPTPTRPSGCFISAFALSTVGRSTDTSTSRGPPTAWIASFRMCTHQLHTCAAD